MANKEMTVRRAVRVSGQSYGPNDADELNEALDKDQVAALKESGAIEGDGWTGSSGSKKKKTDDDSPSTEKDSTVRAGKLAARRRARLGGESSKKSKKAAAESRSPEKTGRATEPGEPVVKTVEGEQKSPETEASSETADEGEKKTTKKSSKK